MGTGKRGVRGCVPVVVDEPTGRLREEHHAERENDGGDHLETPWNAEGRDTIDVRAAKLDEVLKEDTPSDRPVQCQLE